MRGRADRWIKRTTIGCVGLLALIARTVSDLHMHLLVELHGQPGWVAALTPLSVDGMIVAASTTLLAESRSGSRGGVLPWVLLAAGSAGSLAANVPVAEPTATGRLIAAWPSFALIASYELLMRQIRAAAGMRSARPRATASPGPPTAARLRPRSSRGAQDRPRRSWAEAAGLGMGLAHRQAHGSLPSGRAIADQFGRHERWGRLVKQYGTGLAADTRYLAA